MADKPDKSDKSDFTEREKELLALAWSCMTEEPKIDYTKLAEAAGMSNPRSASNAWAKIKVKIMAKAGINKDTGDRLASGYVSPTKNGGSEDGTTKSTPKKRGKGKADGESPAKKTRTKKTKPVSPAAQVKEENGDVAEEEEERDIDQASEHVDVRAEADEGEDALR